MMPLTMAKSGEGNYIKKVTGKDDVRQHLAEMGFVVGESVNVINEIGGNMIVDIKGSRVAICKNMANRIMV